MPITIHIKREETKWYLKVIITWLNCPKQIVTSVDDGAIGLDFSNGFIQMAESEILLHMTEYGVIISLCTYVM